MKPTTELDVLKGLQSSICGLDLDAPKDIYGLHPVERALALGAAMEASAGRIINARCPVTQAWEAICAADFVLDDLTPAEDAELDAWTEAHCAELMAPGIAEREITANWIARAEVVKQRREAMEAEQIDNSHVHPGFAPILAMLAPLGPLTQAFVERGKHV